MQSDLTVLDGAPVALMRMSGTGVIDYANIASRELLRATHAALMGRPIGEIAESAGRDPTTLLQAGSPDEQRLVLTLTRLDGHTLPAIAWVTPESPDGSRWVRLEPVSANEADDTSLESLLSVASASVGAHQAWVLVDRGSHVEVMTELDFEGALEIRYFRGSAAADLPLTRALTNAQPYVWENHEAVVADFPSINLAQLGGLQSGVVMPLISPRGAVIGAIAWAWPPEGPPPVEMRTLRRTAHEVSAALAARDRQRLLTASKQESAMLALRYRSVVEDLEEGVVMWKGLPSLVPTALNPAAKRLLNAQEPADLDGLGLLDIDGHRLASGFLARHTASALHDGRGGATATVGLHRDGSIRWLRLRTRRPGLATGVEAVTIISDITAEREREAELRHRMLHDPLTGLANRSLLMDRLENALARQRRGGPAVGVVFADLDGFKGVNDKLGHAAGDTLLRAVADILRAAVRPGDTVARIGGDEFVVVCDSPSRATLRSVASRILAAAAEPVALEGGHARPSLSLGLALATDASTSRGTLLGQADRAMYVAKEAGGSTSRFHTESRSGISGDVSPGPSITDGLRQGEISPWYQPVIDLATGQTVGVEALARWEREGTVLSGGQFLDDAVEAGLMAQLGGHLTHEAIADSGALAGQHRPTLHLNCSAAELADAGYVPRLMRALQEADLPPTRVVLEFAEHVLHDSHALGGNRMDHLRALGLRVAVDDFGTGRASLNDLAAFNVDMLKVSRELISKLPGDTVSAAVVRGVLAAAKTLGVTVIAEGVETAAQRAWLRANGCQLAQGYFLGEPAPEVEAVVVPLS